jgi:hypothetical protein
MYEFLQVKVLNVSFVCKLYEDFDYFTYQGMQELQFS